MKDSGQRFSESLSTYFGLFIRSHFLHHVRVSSFKKKSEIKHRPLIERLETRDSALALVVPSTAVIQGIKMWPVSL